MPYPRNADLPDSVKVLPSAAQTVWRDVFNDIVKKDGSEDSARKQAWTAVKNGWEKSKDGDWVKKMAQKFQCECLECGYEMESEKHCSEIKCPKCDGEMRRVERPGPGKKLELQTNFSLEDATHRTNGVEIFAAGEWNGDKYSEKDLEEIEKNFNQKIIKNVPLKVGHDPLQKVAGQPAVGIIERVYKVGQKLFADIINVPKVVAELINKKAYHSVSAEIAWDVEWNGNLFEKLLTGVALLGAEISAVNVLSDIPLLYKAKFSKVVTFALENGCIKKEEEIDMEKIKELELKIAELQKKLDEQTQKVKEYQEKELKAKKEIEEKEIKTFSSKLVSDKKILPAQQSRIERSLMDADNSQKKKYSIDNKEVEETPRENLMRLYESMGELNLFKELARASDLSAGTDSEKAISLAKKYEKDEKVSFKDALIRVYQEHPEWENKPKNIKA